jgi:cbb3-type cytochrome oxidase cytochrome c subunit
MSLFRILLSITIAWPAALYAQDDDFLPGLLARYSVGGKSVERIDPDVAFVWQAGSPDTRLAKGPFEVTWKGQLLVRRAGDYRIHAFLQGEVDVRLSATQMLAGRSREAAWISGDEFPLNFGELPLEVTFQKTQPSARLQLFWSSDTFPLEPLPVHLLFHEGEHPQLSEIERGRVEFETLRCNRCHRRQHEMASPAAPALTHFASGLSHDWLVEKIHAPQKFSPHARMPSFGFTFEESKAIAAFVVQQSEQTLEPPKERRLTDFLSAMRMIPDWKRAADRHHQRRQGEVLFRSLGCFACHTVGQHGSKSPYAGGDLTAIGRKRSPDWLLMWLEDPARLNTDHRMPIFRLDVLERRQLSAFLTSLRGNKPLGAGQSGALRGTATALGTLGRALVEAARCAACHRIDGMQFAADALPDLSRPISDASNTCLSKKPDGQTHRPAYQQIDRSAIMAYVNSRPGSLSPPSRFETGQRLLDRSNCLSCHERGLSKGIARLAGELSRTDKSLTGQSETLIPPALTAAGDKFLDAALAQAVSGEQERTRLDWLRVRMPRFKRSTADQEALLDYLIGHDRIPDAAPSAAAVVESDSTYNSQSMVAGRSLLGPKGFSCIACHQLAGYRPENVPPGARGSDLHMLGQRIRQSYYRRWTRSPLRIVSGMEMPSFDRPVEGLLDGNLEVQLNQTWNALNDPRMTSPTDPAAVEQLWIVETGAPARIIRDVFTIPEKRKTVVSRALAVGLNNNHNILFDLDVPAMRQWAFGDFARQQAIGKSWYWDMAGVSVMSGLRPLPDFVLRRHDAQKASQIAPCSQGRLSSYEPSGDGIRFSYALDFDISSEVQTLQISETVLPLPNDTDGRRGGWERHTTISGLPDGYSAFIRRPQPTSSFGSPTVEPADHDSAAWVGFDGSRSKGSRHDYLRFRNDTASATATALLRYESSLVQPSLKLRTKSQLPASISNVTSVPGYDGVRLPLDRSIMPTAITWTSSGTLAFTSLKGHVYLAHDTSGDGLEDTLTLFEEGLAAPYGIMADGNDLLVAHKPELLRLRDTDGDGRVDVRTVIASGWGYIDSYDDWTFGIVRDSKDRLYIGLGSDYMQDPRPRKFSRWRGKILRIEPSGSISPVAHALRFPTGLAISADDEIFITDNQGMQNCFNEINHLVVGSHYGVSSQHETAVSAPARVAAIQVPYPWTRSVNGIFFVPDGPVRDRPTSLAGHGIGCELYERFLIRFTHEKVDGTMQGAVYAFSRPNAGTGSENLLGPLCGAAKANGEIYIGSVHDSGWLGGRNTGAIVRLRPQDRLTNGIREVRARPDGFDIELFAPADVALARQKKFYTVSGYRRVWHGAYATSDSGRHKVNVESVVISDDRMIVSLHVDRLRAGFVYELHCGHIGTNSDAEFWPTSAQYTLHKIPKSMSAN